MAELENILIKSPANFSSMSNGEMITQVHGDNVISFLKSDNNIYSLKWQKHSESNEVVSGVGSNNYESGINGWRINDNGEAEFKNIPLKRFTEIKKIIYYNYMDCKVIVDILQMLEKMI